MAPTCYINFGGTGSRHSLLGATGLRRFVMPSPLPALAALRP
jgi:hypothetical protein